MNIQDWFPLGWTGLISLQSKGLSRVFSNTTVQARRDKKAFHFLVNWRYFSFPGKVLVVFLELLLWLCCPLLRCRHSQAHSESLPWSEGHTPGSSFYVFFPPPGPALCKSSLARSAVCSTWSLHSGPRTFLWPSLSFSHCHFGLLSPILPT